MNKKIISVLMSVAMLSTAGTAFATTEGIIQGDILLTSAEGIVQDDVMATGADKDEEQASPVIEPNNFNSYVAVINDVEEDAISVTIEEDMVVSFKTSENTVILSADGEKTEIKNDDKVIVVSSSLLKTKDVKYAAAIIVNNEEKDMSVYLDKFDIVEERLTSADGNLVLNVEDTKEYAGKNLLVFYSMQTMSIPAQTIPDKIVVVESTEAIDTVTISFNVGSNVLDINNNKVEVEVAPYIAGEGTTLVPLRVISEAFGAEVTWDGETKTVTIIDGKTTIKVVIGSKTALVNGEEKTLEEAAELTGSGVTTVPLRFISETLGAEVGYAHETQLITVAR